MPPLGSEVTESRSGSPEPGCDGIEEAPQSERRIEFSIKQS